MFLRLKYTTDRPADRPNIFSILRHSIKMCLYMFQHIWKVLSTIETFFQIVLRMKRCPNEEVLIKVSQECYKCPQQTTTIVRMRIYSVNKSRLNGASFNYVLDIACARIAISLCRLLLFNIFIDGDFQRWSLNHHTPNGRRIRRFKR